MNIIGHDDEADAFPPLEGQLRIPHAGDDPLGPVVVEQPTTAAGDVTKWACPSRS
jgi:hypothetical protein